jgi:hypothetical protein
MSDNNRTHVLSCAHRVGVGTRVEQNSLATDFELEASVTVLSYFHNVIVAHSWGGVLASVGRSKLGFDETNRYSHLARNR